MLELWYSLWRELSVGFNIFYPVTLTLEFYLFLENFNLNYNFLTVNAGAWIFYINILCDETFLWAPEKKVNIHTHVSNLWPWPRNLTYFLKTFTLLITFQQWMLELWYFTWIFPVIRSFYWPGHLTYLKKIHW